MKRSSENQETKETKKIYLRYIQITEKKKIKNKRPPADYKTHWTVRGRKINLEAFFTLATSQSRLYTYTTMVQKTHPRTADAVKFSTSIMVATGILWYVSYACVRS